MNDETAHCCNPECGWTGPGSKCLRWKHAARSRFCPECHEVVEILKEDGGEMTEELREQIIDTLERNCFTKFDIQADKILSLLAPKLADAERWRKVKEMNEDCSGCPLCKGVDDCGIALLVDALEGEEVKG